MLITSCRCTCVQNSKPWKVFAREKTALNIHELMNEKFSESFLDYDCQLPDFDKRKRYFLLCVDVLKSIMKCIFAFNHYNYIHWLSLHVDNLMKLQVVCPEIYQEFCCSKNPQSIFVNCSGPSTLAKQRNNKKRWWGCWLTFSRFRYCSLAMGSCWSSRV